MKFGKHFHKIGALLLSVILLTSLCTTAFAAEKTPNGMIDKRVSADTAFVRTHVDAMDAIRTGALQLREEINLSSFLIPAADAKTLLSAVKSCYAELFFVGKNFSYSTTFRDGTQYIYNLFPQYEASSVSELNNMLSAFFEKADAYLALLDDSMNDFTKAIVLHDAIVLNAEYFITKNGRQGTPYTLMVEGWGKCEDYTRCYAYLLAQAGIKSEIVDSDSMAHEWIKIQLEGRYYEVDITWDDPTSPDRSTDYPGRVSHDFFLFSDSAFTDHYDYSTVNPSADTTYDHYYLHHMDSQLCMVNGTLYGIYSYSSGGVQIKLVAYTAANELTTVLDIGAAVGQAEGFRAYRWSAGGNSYYLSSYANLGAYDGLLYYNMPKSIYVYDPASGVNLKLADYSNDNQLFGMKISNGTIYGNDSENATVSGSLIKVCACLQIGDVNNDGAVNILDATHIQRHIANFFTLVDADAMKADFDRNGSININDVTSIQYAIAQ